MSSRSCLLPMYLMTLIDGANVLNSFAQLSTMLSGHKTTKGGVKKKSLDLQLHG
jgi:hypothetical protein